MDMKHVQVREATPADKEAVLNIRDDVYGGRDYLPAFYDNLMSSGFTTSFVVLCKGKIVSFASATLIDGGRTIAGRAGRVAKEIEGAGFSRLSTQHMEEWARKRGVHKKINVASEDYLADVTKPSFTSLHKHILTKEVLQYPVEPKRFKLQEPDTRLAQGLTVVTDNLLASYIRSEVVSKYLFPNGRIVVNSVPYRAMESNIPVIREQKDATIIFSDVCNLSSPSGMLSIGTLFHARRPAYAYNIELYGSDITSVRSHIARHMLRLKDKASELIGVFVFVDETFSFDVVDKVFLDYGIKRTLLRPFTKRMMFEKNLEPVSRY